MNKSIDINTGTLILVNHDHPINEQTGLFRVVQNEIILETKCAQMLEKAIEEVGCSNEIVLVSGIRSIETQKNIYDQSVIDNGLEYTKKFVATPGCSEHHTGLAIDIAKKQDEIDFICPELPRVGIYQKLRESLVKNGFIERYLEGKEKITGIDPEPWHFRYVGIPHSEIITENNWVLEEYIGFLKDFDEQNPYVYKDYQIYYVKQNFKELYNNSNNVSGNNVDGWIVTRNKEVTHV